MQALVVEIRVRNRTDIRPIFRAPDFGFWMPLYTQQDRSRKNVRR